MAANLNTPFSSHNVVQNGRKPQIYREDREETALTANPKSKPKITATLRNTIADFRREKKYL